MRKSAFPLVLSFALLSGCGEESSPPSGPSVDVPSKGGSTGSGRGSGGATGSGGSSPVGTGGSTPGSGGASAGTGGTSGGSGGSSGAGGSASADAALETATPAPDGGSTTPPGAYALCPKCRPLFDGKNLDQWNQAAAGAWIVKDGSMASTGKAADAWTKEDFGNYRIFFSVRQISGNHQPGTLYFGNRNGDKPARGLAGIQVQPPNGYTWDYRPGKNNSGAALFMKLPSPKWDVKQWSQCEVLVRDTGELRVACCQLTGNTPCKGVEQLRFKDAAAAGKKSPFGIQMHNGGLFDEYKDIYVEPDPTENDLLSIK